MADMTLNQLAAELGWAGARTVRKARHIVSWGAVDIRENWKATAVGFPSPTLARDHDYSIDYPGIDVAGYSVSVTVGSDDPLLHVVEFGGANHAPRGLGKAALEHAAAGVADALSRIDPFRGPR